MTRKSISKKLRFDVFKRDLFCCQYCGSHPPDVILEVDHINPVFNGGDNSIDNLLTACFECNRGKGRELLTVVPLGLKEKAEAIEERERQLSGYREIVNAQLERIENDMWQVADELKYKASEKGFRKDWLISIKAFLEKMDLHEVIEAAEIAHARIPYSDNQRFKFFCGICWNRIRDQDGTRT